MRDTTSQQPDLPESPEPPSQRAPAEVLRVQDAWVFEHGGAGPLAEMDAYAIRARLKAAPGLEHAQEMLLQVATCMSRSAVRFVALTPEASNWMAANLAGFFAAMHAMAGQLLPVTTRVSAPRLSSSEARILYRIPSLGVAKARSGPRERSKREGWASEVLAPAERDALKAMIVDGFNHSLRIWGRPEITTSLVTVIDEGRFMPIVRSGEGPRTIARLGVRFIMPLQMEGEFFLGVNVQQGLGRVQMAGALARAQTVRLDGPDHVDCGVGYEGGAL